MKSYEEDYNRKMVGWLIFLYLIFSATLFFAQPKSPSQKEENKIKNLETALQSNNEGLTKSAVYLAGKYKIAEVTDELCTLYTNSNNTNLKYLIAIALYKIGTEKSNSAVITLCQNDKSKKFKFIGDEIAEANIDSSRFLTVK